VIWQFNVGRLGIIGGGMLGATRSVLPGRLDWREHSMAAMKAPGPARSLEKGGGGGGVTKECAACRDALGTTGGAGRLASRWTASGASCALGGRNSRRPQINVTVHNFGRSQSVCSGDGAHGNFLSESWRPA